MLIPIKFLINRLLNFLYHVGNFGKLSYQTILAFSDFRTYSDKVIGQMMNIGIRSLPVVGYISIFMGMVVALQAVRQFTQTVPLYIAGTVVEKAVLQELATVMTALVLAGRVGASIAAEIGTMKVTEQIDALQAMAFNPVAFLVVPRLIAGLIMVPVLSIFAGGIAMFSGWLTATTLADLTTIEFFKGAKMYAQVHDFTLPLSKSVLFGASIIMVACYQGLNTKEGAEGVGRAATNAAVSASLMILTWDFVLAKLILS
jgi:phospholipid/cholesterol/gamma-HCH transport system permease protein